MALLGAMMTWARKATPFVLVLGFVFGIAQGASSQGLLDRLLGRGQSYEDCVLANMRGVTSDVAARAVREACDEKERGSRPPPPPRNIIDVTSLITNTGADLKIGWSNDLELSLHHNTPKVIIDHVFISFGPPERMREFRCNLRYGSTGEPGRTGSYWCGTFTQDVNTRSSGWRLDKIFGYRQ
jgi:hypothetical protein